MAEYLAPGVYVEETESGAKPIEGVSTSTAGMVGMAERGPLDVPILVTSAGEYARWFGGILDPDLFIDAAGRQHHYLPHAVEGFFGNGGKRLYAVRVAPEQAQRAENIIFWRDPSLTLGSAALLQPAREGAAAPALITLVNDAFPPALPATNYPLVVRIGDGSAAEYRTVNAFADIVPGLTRYIALGGPLTRTHASGIAISEHAATDVAGIIAAKTLSAAANAGATELLVSTTDDLVAFLAGPPPAADQLPWLAQMSADGATDIAVVTAVEAAGTNLYRFVLNQPLQRGYPFGQAVTVRRSEVAGARLLETDATPGDLMLLADVNGAGAAVVELDVGLGGHEAFMRGAITTIQFAQPLPFGAPRGALFEHVDLVDSDPVATRASTAAALPGGQTLSLNNRENLVVGQVVRVNSGAVEEYGVIVAIPGERGPAPDAGTITLAQPLVRAHAAGIAVQAQAAPTFPAGGNATGRLLLAAASGATEVLLTDGAGWAAPPPTQFARIITTAGQVAFVRIVNASATTPVMMTLTTALARSHGVGEPVVECDPLFAVQALDVGEWGNRLLVSVENETPGLANTRITGLAPPLQFTVESLTGLEAGSLVELRNPAGGATAFLKVRRVDRASGTVTLDPPGLTPAVLASLGAIVDPLELRSREFRLTVHLRRRPDPAVPSRNNLILASETFANLSMDHRHSMYFQRVIGSINGPLRLEDNRPEGESAYVRVFDTLQGAATEIIRIGPETLVDILPGNLIQPARHPLAGGDDSLATMTDAVYLGNDNAEPRLRTGLASLRNLPEVSLVAIPGQGAPALQAGLIAHCELMRYRFAVLDSAEAEASIADVRAQRQLFDTKYAALYYPWLTIPDPMPDNLANIGNFALPPSGHVMGLIARVDNERGVHKAPANEVVRGITGLTRTLQKGEHDILNPSPVNINVIRDFRPEGRGIRLFGARCITSDQQHKYVNVRRLLIFLEQSIERGLQWVVFEPNAEPLWARVTQTVGNFLTDVWRGGALEGTEPTQGFFALCDRTTMTQSDIDNGRLICVIGVAPVKPAEFVIIRIGLTTRSDDNA